MQLILNLQSNANKNPYLKEDFLLLPENSSAFRSLKDFFLQNHFLQSNFRSLILKGDDCSGKSHLLTIFATDFSADFLKYEHIADVNLSSFLLADRFYILEDIDKIDDEKFLFHLINASLEANSFLIFSAKSLSKFSLKDLKSRLGNIFTAEIKNPSLESMQQLLVQSFSRKQIKLDNRIINFIAEKIDRSYKAIYDAVKLVEFHNFKTGKTITMKEVREIFTSN
ncbi:MAG: hypothetical protein FJ368_04955 [Pelagibacterales bacterium]|nr:hypothetical protein [Pelagibacterales bacterium]